MSRTAAHRAGAPRRAVFSVVGTLKACAVLVVALVLSLSVVGGTYATLSAAQPITLVSGGAPSATITAGSADLAVSTGTIALTGLYPGVGRTAEFQVGNTGSTALAVAVVSITGPTTANGLVATVANGSCTAPGAAVASGPLGATVAPGGTAVVCLSVALPAAAPASAQGATTAVSIALSGTQP